MADSSTVSSSAERPRAGVLLRRLADQLLETHPARAVTLLERLPEEQSRALVRRSDAPCAARLLERLSPQYGAAVLTGLESERAAAIVEELPVEVAVRLLRRLEEAPRTELLASLPTRRARSIERLLRFGESTVGALMDPDVLALPQELSARDALRRVRREAANARYNLYVVDQGQRLVGAVSLRELLIAPDDTPLSDLMSRDPYRLEADAERASLVAHPGWRAVHALPVVDRDGGYLGAVRYRTLRALEGELDRRQSADADSGAALGELIAAGARGLFDAFSGTEVRDERRARGAR